MNKIIAVDFDGTLAIGDHWPEIGEPNWPVINYILGQKAEGAKIILWTNRTDKPLEYAIEWCQDHGIIFDAVNENLPEVLEWLDERYPESRKIYAHEYIDDRAINPDYCKAFYADNIPYMLTALNERNLFQDHLCHILKRYFPTTTWFDLLHISEDIIREFWKIEDC